MGEQGADEDYRWRLLRPRGITGEGGYHETASSEIVPLPLLPPAISRVHREPSVHPVQYLRAALTIPGESQKAFNLLSKRLKPLEHYQPIPYDFYNLAYLTSAGTVHDAPGLKDWSGEALEREKLVGTWRELMKQTDGENQADDHARSGRHVKEGRLEDLLRQAGAWQVQRAKGRAKGPWTISR